MLKEGLTYTATTTVTDKNTAASYGSGKVDVFATPAMVALMENAARHAVAPELPENSTTVGVAVNITHTKSTPIGKQVSSTAVLTGIDGRKLTFDVTATDEDGQIGSGTHTRIVVDTARFMEKTRQ